MMTTPPDFDPVAYKESTRQQWQRVAAAWNSWGPTLERWWAPVTEAMLEMARIGPGSRALDIAGGSGEPCTENTSHNRHVPVAMLGVGQLRGTNAAAKNGLC
jgi:hypothetical protein